MPERLLGRDLFWWLDRLGLLRAPRDSIIGRYLQRTDNFPGKALSLDNLRQQGVTVVGRLLEAQGHGVFFTDGFTASVATVIWATGYQDETAWVAIPAAKDAAGRFLEHQGISPVPGLYFIGRSWQRNRGSALLAGVSSDAGLLVPEIVRQLSRQPRLAKAAPETPAVKPMHLAG